MTSKKSERFQTKHQKRYRDLAKLPGMRAKISGRFADTATNRSFISRLANQLEDVIKRPKAYKAIRSRSKKSGEALKGQRGIGNLKFVDKGNFSDVSVQHGRLVRWRNEETASGMLTVRAVQLMGPGPNLISRLRRFARTTQGMRMTRNTGNLFGQIRGRPFVTQSFAEGTQGNIIKAAIRYWQEWQPNGNKAELLDSVSVIYHKFVRFEDEEDRDFSWSADEPDSDDEE